MPTRRSPQSTIAAVVSFTVAAVLATLLLVPSASPPATQADRLEPVQASEASPTPAPSAGTATPSAADGRARDAGCVIVKYRQGWPVPSAANALGGEGLVLLPVPDGTSTEEFSSQLADDPGIEFAQPDHLLKVADFVTYTSSPNDTSFRDPTAYWFGGGTTQTAVPYAKSWALHGAYSSRFDAVWPALNSAEATIGQVHVAVIDTGFYFDHPDARFSNIRAAIDECATYSPAAAKITTDAIVEPVPLSSIVDTDPVGVAAHGTMTASVVGASANNLEGSLGAAYDTVVDVYKVQGIAAESGDFVQAGEAIIPESAIVNAINDAVADSERNGYRLVINISLVLEDLQDFKALRSAVTAARTKGVVVVAASGNEPEKGVLYPAAFPSVIAVGASTVASGQVQRAPYSCYGSELDLIAPGTSIWGPTKPWFVGDPESDKPGYTWWTGTSMAAPHVSSAAALLLRVEPSLTATEVTAYLTEGAQDLEGQGWDARTGWGTLDVYRSYYLLTAPRTSANVVPRYALEATIDFTVTDRDSDNAATTYYRLGGDSELTGSSATFTWLGHHTLEYWSVDSNGIREEPRFASFDILMADTTPPVTSDDATATYAGRATILLSATDDEEHSWGLQRTHYRLDGVASTGTTVTTGATGAHTLEYWSTDQAGNAEQVHTVHFTVKPLATTATIARSRSTVYRGSRVTLSGTLAPALKGDYVRIQVKTPGSRTWKYLRNDWRIYRRTVTAVDTAGLGTWSPVTVSLNSRGRYYFRGVFSVDSTKLSRSSDKSNVVSVYVR